jgi:hypothetical protein
MLLQGRYTAAAAAASSMMLQQFTMFWLKQHDRASSFSSVFRNLQRLSLPKRMNTARCGIMLIT